MYDIIVLFRAILFTTTVKKIEPILLHDFPYHKKLIFYSKKAILAFLQSLKKLKQTPIS